MTKKIIFPLILAFIVAGCHSGHDHDHDSDHNHDQHNELNEDADHIDHNEDIHDHNDEPEEHEDYEQQIEDSQAHEHEDLKIQFTAYSHDFEVFAEADPFVTGKSSLVLAHFTHLQDFSPLENGKVSLRLIVDGNETVQIQETPTKKGIYLFNIDPQIKGTGSIVFEIDLETENFKISVPDIIVYDDAHDAIHEAEHANETLSTTNTTVFTKEQSWLIDFATEQPKKEAFGQVIKTTAQVRPAQTDKILVSALINGIVTLSKTNLLEGISVSKEQSLFSISGKDLVDNNSTVRYMEAQNNYEKAKADYERLKELAKDKIISEKDLLTAKNQYDNTKVIYDNLSKNFNTSGQIVKSPMTGFINQLFVQNGEYVESGQAIMSISQNKSLILHADIQQKYAGLLSSINSADIRTLHDNKTYTLEELNGKVLSYGRSTNYDNYLIPFAFQIENTENFLTGGFVEIYLKSLTNEQALTIPNSAILEEQGNYFVYVQITPELFEKREIKPGSMDGFRTEILKGIRQDERIVSSGAIFIKLAQGIGALDAHSGHIH